MSKIIEKLEVDLKHLSSRDKAALAHFLIEELDGEVDDEVEDIWRLESESRYMSYKKGELKSTSGDEVMLRARNRLK